MTATREEILILLASANMSQGKAAEILHVNARTFRRWIAGRPPMPETAWELLQIKIKTNIIEERNNIGLQHKGKD
jgi:DNA-binding transcriptional regulator YiaG